MSLLIVSLSKRSWKQQMFRVISWYLIKKKICWSTNKHTVSTDLNTVAYSFSTRLRHTEMYSVTQLTHTVRPCAGLIKETMWGLQCEWLTFCCPHLSECLHREICSNQSSEDQTNEHPPRKHTNKTTHTRKSQRPLGTLRLHICVLVPAQNTDWEFIDPSEGVHEHMHILILA